MEIRELTADDFFKLSGIAEKISGDLIEKITDNIDDQKFGFQMLLTILKYVPHEIREFLAHVTDQSADELNKKAFTEPIKILKALYARPEFKDFLHEMNFIREEIQKRQQT